MKNMIRIKYLIITFLFAITAFFIIYLNQNRLTYIENEFFNEHCGDFIEINENGDSISQEFTMPYEILYSVSLDVGTFGRINNSDWEASVVDKESGKILESVKFNAKTIEDNNYFDIVLSKKHKVKIGQKYILKIQALNVSSDSSLAFFTSKNSQIKSPCVYNDKNSGKELCLKISGGKTDFWWSAFYFTLIIFLLVLLLRCYLLEKEGKKANQDLFVQSMFVGTIVFILLFTFSVSYGFTDETDNMCGGMVIATGKVLYRDYVTQHTPVAYYLCAVFAKLGAGSAEQFRLSYYMSVALFWSFIYIRHANFFGRKKLFALSIFETICISSLLWPYGTQILSDNIQGMLFLLLLLEFIRYNKDKELGLDRSIVISICIWGSIGSAFISVYALIWIVIVVFIIEILYWCSNKFTIKKSFFRYNKLVISLIFPFIIALIYFRINNSLKIAYDQFYTFNRLVYPKYLGGLGSNLIQPFEDGIRYIFEFFPNNIRLLMSTSDIREGTRLILKSFVMLAALFVIIALGLKKKYAEAVVLLSTMIFSATRGYDFHGLAAWYICIMIIALYFCEVFDFMPIKNKPVLILILVIICTHFSLLINDNINVKQQPVSLLESKAIALTENMDNKDIFLDLWSNESLYYYYKGRFPVNQAQFMLPWYMDWFEDENIKALKESKPYIVIYNENAECWGIKGYSPDFLKELKNHYKKVLVAGNENYLWVRND